MNMVFGKFLLPTLKEVSTYISVEGIRNLVITIFVCHDVISTGGILASSAVPSPSSVLL
jgi:hypothetical protein